MKKMIKNFIPREAVNAYHGVNAAAAVIANGSPGKKLKVIGVTGTDGKTTTASIIYNILHESGKKVALISTVGAVFDDEKVDVGFHVTTTSPRVLQKMMKKAVDEGYEFLVLEATSHGFDQHRLMGANICYAVITNISHEHLDYHKSMDKYIQAKAKILNKAEVVVANKNDEMVNKLIDEYNQDCQVIWFDASYKSKLSDVIRKSVDQKFNQENALAAAYMCKYLGIDETEIINTLKTGIKVPGRMEYIENSLGITVVVDFAHTPKSMETVLAELRKKTQEGGQLIVVFGAAGERDVAKRPIMGKISTELADLVVLTTEDPRSENVNSIINQIKSGVVEGHDKLMTVVDRQKAIEMAINELAKKDDVVAILGKGHEKSMNFDGINETDWSDLEAVKLALGKNYER